MKNKTPLFVTAVGIILSVGILGISLSIKNEGDTVSLVQDSSLSREEFIQEFTGVYEKDIQKTGNIKELKMSASEGEIEIFEGQKTKIWSYNNSVPAPEIRINLGDTLKVHFTNNLPEETTIHFHGVRVPNAMDGVPGVTQDPIQPGDTFIYEFTPKDAGTFWFHPHVNTSEQMEKGLYGVLIVEDENSKKYSQDKVWAIDDWRLQNDYQVYPYFNTPHDLMHDGRWGNVITVNGSLQQKLVAQPGERILLRLVNTSNARVYSLNFDSLEANVVAADGMYVKRVFDANGFELAPGNRIDVDLKIPTDARGKSFAITDTFTRNVNTLGQILVEGEKVQTSQFNYPSNQKLPEWEGAEDVPFDKEYVLNARRSASGGMGMMGGIEWTINGKAFPDYDPFELRYGEFNKIRFTNDSYRLHPMHLHGQFFKVITRNGKRVDEPYFRDTVLVHPKETVEIGIVPLDKGEWANHCHILEHADSGMMTITTVQ